MTILHVLTEARALIATPVTWTVGTYGRTATGRPVADVTCAEVVAFCAVGAIRRVTRTSGGDMTLERAVTAVIEAAAEPSVTTWWAGLTKAEQDKTHRNVQCWQDHPKTAHGDVLAVLDRAIAVMEDS